MHHLLYPNFHMASNCYNSHVTLTSNTLTYKSYMQSNDNLKVIVHDSISGN